MSDNPQLVVDVDSNDLMLFAQNELLMSLAKVSNKIYPQLKYSRLMPVVNLPGYEWENQFEITEFDSFGIAQVLADSANDGGLVGVVARRTRYSIKTLTDYVRIPWLLLQQAQAKGMPLDAKYAAALVYGMEKKNNDIAYNGDTDYGLQGIFTSQLPRMNALYPLSTSVGSTADQRLSVLNTAVSTVVQNCANVWIPKIIALPTKQLQFLSNDVYSTTTGKTVMQTFMENQTALGQIEAFIADDTLVGKGENGSDAMLVLPGPNPMLNTNEADTPTGNTVVESGALPNYPMYYAIAKDFDVPMEFKQWDDTVYKERAVERVCGFIVEDPRTGLIVSNV